MRAELKKGPIYRSVLNIHEYNAYPYLNNNKILPASIISKFQCNTEHKNVFLHIPVSKKHKNYNSGKYC